MKVKELISQLALYPPEYEILFSSDEELNTLRSRGEVAELSHTKKTVVIYGFDGSEVEL